MSAVWWWIAATVAVVGLVVWWAVWDRRAQARTRQGFHNVRGEVRRLEAQYALPEVTPEHERNR